MAGTEPTVAAFDFDGTLTRRDTLLPFLRRVVGVRPLASAMASVAPRLAVSPLRPAQRDAGKAQLLARVLAGLPHEEVVAHGTEYGSVLAAQGIRSQVLARLRWHRDQGHEILVVSASLDVYLDEVARRIGVDALLCTRLEVDERGRLTGRMLDGNCRGAGKVERLRAHLGDGPVRLWAYGDSAGDREMLAAAHHPVRVIRRSGRLVPADRGVSARG